MKSAEVDTSGFQNIVLMLVGVLMIMLISNVLTIISNPDNIKIGALVTGTVYEEEGETGDATTFIPPKFQNMEKNPIYVEVEARGLMIYHECTVVTEAELRLPGNEFEKFLDQVALISDQRYIVLLMRPDCALFQRKIRRIVQDRHIDIGFEPWESSRVIKVAGMIDVHGNLYEEEGPANADAPAATEAPARDELTGEEAETAFDQAAETVADTGEGGE